MTVILQENGTSHAANSFDEIKQTRILELATQIFQDTSKVNVYLLSTGLPQPSFGIDGPTNLNFKFPEAEEARVNAIGASIELADLLRGPASCLRPAMNASSLQAIYRWDIPNKVPLDGSEISFSALAEKCDMYEPNLRRILRYAILYHRVFQEPRPGFVTHSAASALLVKNPAAFDALGLMFDESWAAWTRTCDALQQYGGQEPNETGYSLAYTPSSTVWEHHAKHPHLAKRFANSMRAFSSSSGHSPTQLATGYPWSDIPPSSTIVEIGGSEGHVSAAIAKTHPHLTFVVQDLPRVIETATLPNDVDEGVRKRMRFEAHDFLTDQTTQGEVFLMRWILHDWSDKYVVKILRHLRPALRPGNKIIVNDQLMPEPGKVGTVAERHIRYSDMTMLALFNSREREKGDWEGLFREADSRFSNIKIWTPTGSALSIIEATWTP